MNTHGNILIVDDDPAMCGMLEEDLSASGFIPVSYTSADEAFNVLKECDFDAILTDMNLPGMNGIQFCERIVANRPDIPVLVITAFGSMDSAIAAIRAGAYDFINKPVKKEMLIIALDRAVKHHSLQKKVSMLSEAVRDAQQFEELTGESQTMQDLFIRLTHIADTETSILITGESGTGKELVAHALHSKSRRADGPFVPVSCAALPGSLLESELFGHAKGAFTDAKNDRKGLILQADGGTLFLDEIGEFPLPLQPKLLRALEERAVRPVGSDSEIGFNVRIISATNRNLESEIEEDRFREDLYYRLNVIQVKVPPLRSRGTDVLLLAQRFIEKFAARSGKKVAGISSSAAARLLSYSWPGNVRELRNAIERAVALTSYEHIAVEDLPGKLRSYENSFSLSIKGHETDELASLNEVERNYIKHVLEKLEGNKTLTARILGIDRKTLYRKLRKYGIDE